MIAAIASKKHLATWNTAAMKKRSRSP